MRKVEEKWQWCKRKVVEEGSWMLWEEMRASGAATFLFLSERRKRNLY